MKYIDYIKHIISIRPFKNVLRFPIEKVIQKDMDDQEARKDTPHKEWLKGYRKWKRKMEKHNKKKNG